MDYELFGKELSSKFIYTDTCINTISFKSTKGLSWNIDGKVKVISPNKMVYKMMEKKQADLKKRYELGAEDSHHFEVIKCEACGKYLVHYRDYKIREKEKCPFCKEFILHPFSFGKSMFINIPAKEMCYDMEKDKFERFLQLINPYGIKYKADKQSRINGMTREAGYFNYLISNRQDLSDEETELRDRIKDWSVNGTSLVDESLEKGQAEEIEDLQEKIRELENKVSQQSQEIEAQEKQLDKLNFEIETYERNEKYLRGEIEKAKGQEVKEQPADKLNRSVVNKMVELYENNMTLEVYEKLIRIYAEKSGRELNR